MNPTGDFEKYADIIDLPHHQSATRPHMPLEDRAAQFSPFAALTGYEDAVKETARLTDEPIELDEYSKEELNRQLSIIRENLKLHGKTVAGEADVGRHYDFTYFVPDARKSGGAYVTVRGVVKKIKESEQLLILTNETEISISDIISIEEPTEEQ